MRYVLGIDIGSTCASAAVSRLVGDTWTDPEAVRLSPKSRTVPSVLHLSPGGSVTIGEPEGRGKVADDRVIRGFIRRIGDDVPLVVGGESCPAQGLTAILAMWIVEQVVHREGDQPDQIVLCHPATWGPYRKEVLLDALLEIGLTNVRLLPGPVAAAESHAARGFSGDTLAVHTLGGSSFEASVVRRADPGFRLVGWPLIVDTIGGADFDEALVELVRAKLSQKLGLLDDSQVQSVLVGMRDECVKAKERLSATSETDLVLALPHGPARVSVTRVEFDNVIRPLIQVTADELIRGVRSADIEPDQLDGVLLTGGSAQIPLVAQLLAAQLPTTVTVAIDAEPQFAAARGAALVAGALVQPAAVPRAERLRMAASRSVKSATNRPPDTSGRDRNPDTRKPDIGKLAPPPRPPVMVKPLKLPEARRSGLINSRKAAIIGVVVVAIVVGLVMTFFFGSGGAGQTAPAGLAEHRRAVEGTFAAHAPHHDLTTTSGWSQLR